MNDLINLKHGCKRFQRIKKSPYCACEIAKIFFYIAIRVMQQIPRCILQISELFIQSKRISSQTLGQLSTKTVNFLCMECENRSIKSRQRSGCRSVAFHLKDRVSVHDVFGKLLLTNKSLMVYFIEVEAARQSTL